MASPDQESRPDCTCGAYWDGDLSVPHSAGCAMGVRERAERNVLEQKAILDLLAETDGPDQEPRPATLVIGRFDSRCGECRRGADPSEKTHDTCLGYGAQPPGCGVRWTHVVGSYSGTDDAIRRMRPDLTLISTEVPHA